MSNISVYISVVLLHTIVYSSAVYVPHTLCNIQRAHNVSMLYIVCRVLCVLYNVCMYTICSRVCYTVCSTVWMLEYVWCGYDYQHVAQHRNHTHSLHVNISWWHSSLCMHYTLHKPIHRTQHHIQRNTTHCMALSTAHRIAYTHHRPHDVPVHQNMQQGIILCSAECCTC